MLNSQMHPYFICSQVFPPLSNLLSPAVPDRGRAKGVSLTSTWVTSNIVISTSYPSKWYKESRGTGRRVSVQNAGFPAICQRSTVPLVRVQWSVRAVTLWLGYSFSLSYLSKRQQFICFCACRWVQSSVYPFIHEPSSLSCRLLSFPSSFVLSTITIASVLYHSEFSQRKTV